MGTIRVATYNVRGCRGLDRRNDPGRIAGIIKRLNVDILALQEVATQWGWEIASDHLPLCAEIFEK